MRTADVVALRDGVGGLPLGALSGRLAEAVAEQFGDAVAVLHVGPRPPDAARSRRVEHAWVEPGRLAAELRARRGLGLVVVDGPGAEAHATRVVQVGGPAPEPTVLHTRLVGPRSPGSPRSIGAVLRDGALARLRGRRSPGALAVPYPALTRSGGRLRLDGDREALLRWARVVTGRSVGVALGGGGAWGYGSVAVLEALADAGVPVDLVAGSSSGALVGAWYAAFGAAGLERLVARGPDLRRALPAMALTTAPAEWLVDEDLGGARLEELERELLPVATDLATAEPVVFVEGSVAFAARASVSAPGLFAPTRGGDRLYADGAVGDNAPCRPLEARGAALVVAANPMPSELPDAGRGRVPAADLVSRARHLRLGLARLISAAGNPEPGPRRVVYRAPPVADPLGRLLRYDDAARVRDAARRDPALREAVAAALSAWREVARPRGAPHPLALEAS